MKRLDIVLRVRSYTRDFSNSIFRQSDVEDYINEGIDRMKEFVPELSAMVYLTANAQEPILLPEQYHHLLAVYAASRCFAQDERHFQSTNLMNEFETKVDELYSRILQGTIVILGVNGLPVAPTLVDDFVKNVYSTATNYSSMKWYFKD